MEWVVTVVAVEIIIISVLIIHYRVYKQYHYVCSKCSTSFKPTFLRSIFAFNGGDTRMMKCPTCNHIESVKAVKDE